MNKKAYISPSLKVLHLTASCVFAMSDVTDEGRGIGYGGVDEDGVIIPSVNSWNSWEEDFWSSRE